MAESRLLSFGLQPEGIGEGEKLHQRIILFNVARRALQVVLKETVQQAFPFAKIKKVRKSEKDECSFSFFCEGAQSFSLETENDRDDCVIVLDSLREEDLNNIHHDVGATKIFDGMVKKKGKIKWADRWLIVVKGRLLLFRTMQAALPINAISMSDAIAKMGKSRDVIIVSTLYRDYSFRFQDANGAHTWFAVIQQMAEKAAEIAKDKKEQRVDRTEGLARLKAKKEERDRKEEEERKVQYEKQKQDFYHSEDSGDEFDALKPKPRPEIILQAPTQKKIFQKGRRDGLFEFEEKMDLVGAKRIFAWGNGELFQLGNGNTGGTDFPTEMKRLSSKKLIAITCAKGEEASHSFGLNVQGRVLAWGSGILGLGERQTYSQSPYIVQGLRQIAVTQVAASYYHTMCLSEKGRIYGWGTKELTGLPNHTFAPQQIPFLNKRMNIIQISANINHTAAITKEGRLYVWGKRGPWLGLGNRFVNAPEHDGLKCVFGEVPFGGVKIRNVSCGAEHTAVVTSSGQVLTFGVGANGRLGLGDMEDCDTPQPVTGLEGQDIGKVSCGDAHTMALTKQGQVFTWGCGRRHRLGHGNQADQPVPKLVFSLLKADIVRINAGSERSFVISKGGGLIAWGYDPARAEQEQPYPNPCPRPRLEEYVYGYRVYDASMGHDFAVVISQRGTKRMQKPDIAKEGARNVEELQERLAASGIGQQLPDAPQIGRDFHVDQETEYYENDRSLPAYEDPEMAAIASFGIGGGGDPFASALLGSQPRAQQHGFPGGGGARQSGFGPPPGGHPPPGGQPPPPSHVPNDPFQDPYQSQAHGGRGAHIRQARGSEAVPLPPPSDRVAERPYVPMDALPPRAPSFAVGGDKQSVGRGPSHGQRYSHAGVGRNNSYDQRPSQMRPQYDPPVQSRQSIQRRPQYDQQHYGSSYQQDEPPPPPPSYIPGDEPPPPSSLPPPGPPQSRYSLRQSSPPGPPSDPPGPPGPPSGGGEPLAIKVVQNGVAIGAVDFAPSTRLNQLRNIMDYELDGLIPTDYTFLLGRTAVPRGQEGSIFAAHSVPEIHIR